jgi:hypothetical protein
MGCGLVSKEADKGELIARYLYMEPLDGLGLASEEADKGGLLARFLYLEPLDAWHRFCQRGGRQRWTPS